jgi:hypothetical protein
MTHHASPKFWAAYEALHIEARGVADKSFALLKSNPQHPSIRLKKVGNYGLASDGVTARWQWKCLTASCGSGSAHMRSTTD